MCILCYTLLCVSCATQDRDAGANSSPFTLLLMRSRCLGRGGGYESDICKKNTEAPTTLCFILTPLYYTDPYQMLTSYILTKYEPSFFKKFGSLLSKNCTKGLGKPVFDEKSAQEAFFEGLKNNFLSDKTLTFLLQLV